MHVYVRGAAAAASLCVLAGALIMMIRTNEPSSVDLNAQRTPSFSLELLQRETAGFGRYVTGRTAELETVPYTIPMIGHNCTEHGKHCCDKGAPFECCCDIVEGVENKAVRPKNVSLATNVLPGHNCTSIGAQCCVQDAPFDCCCEHISETAIEQAITLSSRLSNRSSVLENTVAQHIKLFERYTALNGLSTEANVTNSKKLASDLSVMKKFSDSYFGHTSAHHKMMRDEMKAGGDKGVEEIKKATRTLKPQPAFMSSTLAKALEVLKGIKDFESSTKGSGEQSKAHKTSANVADGQASSPLSQENAKELRREERKALNDVADSKVKSVAIANFFQKISAGDTHQKTHESSMNRLIAEAEQEMHADSKMVKTFSYNKDHAAREERGDTLQALAEKSSSSKSLTLQKPSSEKLTSPIFDVTKFDTDATSDQDARKWSPPDVTFASLPASI